MKKPLVTGDPCHGVRSQLGKGESVREISAGLAEKLILGLLCSSGEPGSVSSYDMCLHAQPVPCCWRFPAL